MNELIAILCFWSVWGLVIGDMYMPEKALTKKQACIDLLHLGPIAWAYTLLYPLWHPQIIKRWLYKKDKQNAR